MLGLFNVILNLFLIVHLCIVVQGYSSGAPTTACVSQSPVHSGATAQDTPSPYSIQVSSETYRANQPLTVTVSGTFQGLILQARPASGDTTPLGMFNGPPDYTKIVKCSSADDTWTHSSKDNKTNISVMWNPPSGDVGEIHFIATVAEEKNTYWMNIESPKLKADSSNSAGESLPMAMWIVIVSVTGFSLFV